MKPSFEIHEVEPDTFVIPSRKYTTIKPDRLYKDVLKQ